MLPKHATNLTSATRRRWRHKKQIENNSFWMRTINEILEMPSKNTVLKTHLSAACSFSLSLKACCEIYFSIFPCRFRFVLLYFRNRLATFGLGLLTLLHEGFSERCPICLLLMCECSCYFGFRKIIRIFFLLSVFAAVAVGCPENLDKQTADAENRI